MTSAAGVSCGAGARRAAAVQPDAPAPHRTGLDKTGLDKRAPDNTSAHNTSAHNTSAPNNSAPNNSAPNNSAHNTGAPNNTSAEAPRSAAAAAGAAFAAYRAGDSHRLNELVSVTTPILWHTVRSYRLDSATTEDVLQSAWLALVRRAEYIDDPQAVLQWLIVTARREAWRVATASRRTEPSAWDNDEFTAPAAEQPETIVVRSAQDRLLWEHIKTLSVRCQQLLRVIAFSDRPDYEAISHALGIPLGSIGPTRGRCLAKLRAALTADATWST